MTVEDLMSVALLCARPDDSMRRADLTMRYADIRHLPVVDEQHRVIGIVSDRDVLRGLRRRKRPLRVRDIMTRKVRMVHPDTPAAEAAGLMMQHKIGALPVVDEHGALLGLLTETDFLRAVARRVSEAQHPAQPGD